MKHGHYKQAKNSLPFNWVSETASGDHESLPEPDSLLYGLGEAVSLAARAAFPIAFNGCRKSFTTRRASGVVARNGKPGRAVAPQFIL